MSGNWSSKWKKIGKNLNSVHLSFLILKSEETSSPVRNKAHATISFRRGLHSYPERNCSFVRHLMKPVAFVLINSVWKDTVIKQANQAKIFHQFYIRCKYLGVLSFQFYPKLNKNEKAAFYFVASDVIFWKFYEKWNTQFTL